MTCIFKIELSTSDVMALLAMLVAGLSALYARRSWREARRANQISLLGQKKEIYYAFFALKMHMIQRSELAEMKEVSKFHYPAMNANIYLPSKLAKSVDTYFDACFRIADIHQQFNGMTTKSREECKPHIATERSLAPKIEKELIKLLKESQA
jgi:uncharacterized protein (TIGR03382 family)